MKLTEIDRMILQSYDTVLDGLAQYLGDGCEIVLHSLENLDKSVIKIVNGHHTGRKVGAPITHLALEMLDEIKKKGKETGISYFTHNKNGEPLKSATIVIKGENERIIGLLCINFYLNMPLSSFLNVFTLHNKIDGKETSESFWESGYELIAEATSHARQVVLCDSTILPSLKNRSIIQILYKQGIFNMKNAVDLVAEQLKISKNTVYMHLRCIKEENSEIS